MMIRKRNLVYVRTVSAYLNIGAAQVDILYTYRYNAIAKKAIDGDPIFPSSKKGGFFFFKAHFFIACNFCMNHPPVLIFFFFSLLYRTMDLCNKIPCSAFLYTGIYLVVHAYRLIRKPKSQIVSTEFFFCACD